MPSWNSLAMAERIVINTGPLIALARMELSMCRASSRTSLSVRVRSERNSRVVRTAILDSTSFLVC